MGISLPVEEPKRSRSRRWLVLPFLLFASIFLWSIRPHHHVPPLRDGCKQADPILPDGYNLSTVHDHRDRVINWLSQAVQIPTEIFDDMGPVDQDPRWKVFGTFHDYLEASFPLIHRRLKRTKTDWALVYEFTGSDSSLKPFMLTAHQDVVPVFPSTRAQWSHDPYGGEYDGKDIWGRGAYDTKGSLIALMAALEIVLEETDFTPRRTLILAFGTDEEAGGRFGAPAIAKHLLKNYGKDSIAMIMDEGSGLMTNWGRTFGMPAVGEKGHYDLGVEVRTLGGHSSNPPPHTAIGYLALLIAKLEANPHPAILPRGSPLYSYMTCAAAYSDVPGDLRDTFVAADSGDEDALAALPEAIINSGVKGSPRDPGQGVSFRALMSTTQAVDLISGGLKVNALPETASVAINHRINIVSNHTDLERRTLEFLAAVARDYDLGIVDFAKETVLNGSHGTIILSNAFGYYTEPAKWSPWEGPEWDMLAGTARGVWSSRPAVSPEGVVVDLPDGEDLIMAPFLTTGNTDTRRHTDLTDKIYRWRYHPMEDYHGAHTINERADANGLIEFARYYQAIILNMDASDIA